MPLYSKPARRQAGLAALVVTVLAPLNAPSGHAASDGPGPAALSAAAAPADAYGAAVVNDGAQYYWRLDETGGSSARDAVSGETRGTYTSGVLLGETGSPAGPGGTSIRFPGTSQQTMSGSVQVTNPAVYSLEVWFRTTSTRGGRLIGFGNARTGASPTTDRMIYLLDTGQVRYGIQTTQGAVIDSPRAYNDGRWHHVVATQGPGGQKLYVDGAQVASGGPATPLNYSGYWRLGSDSTWGGNTSNHLAGWVDEAAVYPVVLSGATIAQHHDLGTPSNLPPVAAFTSTVDKLTAGFDGRGSRDEDGAVTAYAWNFGDGSTGTGSQPSHTYATGGTYPVTLTVTDDRGATASVTRTVTAVANVVPTAAFSADCTDLGCSLDASASSDPDGSVAGYSWDFGDGATGTGVRPSHTYTAGGSYTATLTVTDDDGARDTLTREITVVDPVLAVDTFERSVASGLGTAEKGGEWAFSGVGTSASVTGGSARLSIGPARLATAQLASVSSLDTELEQVGWLEATPGGTGVYIGNSIRTTDLGAYRLRLRINPVGTVTAQFLRTVLVLDTGVGSAVNVPNVTYTAGTKLRIRTQAFGASPTTLRAKIWVDGTSEPTAWTVSTTDSTIGFQSPGSIGLWGYATGTAPTSVVRFDDIGARILKPADQG